MSTVNITKDNFNDTITQNKLVILDFWASWCGPCLRFAPVFEEAAKKFPDVVFGKINTEEEEELAAFFEIQAIPTLIIFHNQQGIFKQSGALPPHAFNDLVEQARAYEPAPEGGEEDAGSED